MRSAPRLIAIALAAAGVLAAPRAHVAGQQPAQERQQPPPATAAQQPQPEPFRSSVDLVSVFVTVVDDDGRLVTDLKAEDFEVRDEGQRRPLALFSAKPAPFSAVVMLDRSGSMSSHVEAVNDAAAAFIAEMQPGDRARIGSFSSSIRLAPGEFTADKDQLLEVLKNDKQENGPSPVWTAVDRSMTALAPMPDRRVVLFFSDGHDDPGYGQVRTKLDDVLRRTRANGVMVYTIGFPAEADRTSTRPPFDPRRGPIRFPIPVPREPPSTRPRGPVGPPGGGYVFGRRFEPPDPGLEDLAEASGGAYFEMEDIATLRETFVRISRELRHQYWLGFVPARLDGRAHEIEVKVKRRGVDVRARKHYVALPRSAAR
jgi:Ca-activated chloride channel family protein